MARVRDNAVRQDAVASALAPELPEVAASPEVAEILAPVSPPSPPPPTPTTRRARVSVPQTHFGTVEVEIPADSPDPYSAAVAAAARLRGVAETSPGRFGFGAGPQVEFLD